DAHLENFGVMLDDQKDPVFTMNDMDDAGPCPLYADLLRFVVASELSDEDINLGDVLDSYALALTGQEQPLSNTAEALARLASGAEFPDPHLLDGPHHFKREPGIGEPTAAQARAAQAALTNMFGPSVRVLDEVSLTKDSGGSGGLLRLRAFVNY